MIVNKYKMLFSQTIIEWCVRANLLSEAGEKFISRSRPILMCHSSIKTIRMIVFLFTGHYRLNKPIQRRNWTTRFGGLVSPGSAALRKSKVSSI